MTQVEIDRLLTRDEVESQFAISKRFLELACSSGVGPAFVRIGRSIRYRVGDIREWIAQNRVQTRGDGDLSLEAKVSDQ